MGGTMQTTSAFDWKVAAIQQIGLTISKKFKSIEDSFEDAAGSSKDKVHIQHFEAFLAKT